MKHLIKFLSLSCLIASLSACSFFEKDNTPKPSPLVTFTAEIKPQLLWYSNTNFGIEKEYLKLTSALSNEAIFTAGKHGTVTASAKKTGKTLWKVETKSHLSAGPIAYHDLVILGSRNGKVLALRQSDGKQMWTAQVGSEILATPAASKGIIIIKTIDGELTALAEQDGHALWSYHQAEPTLILRGGSTPQIQQNLLVAGFANGTLAQLTLNEGSLLWQQTIAIPQGGFAIQRMIDIDASPLIFNNRIYVATYQGKIAALNFETGKELWSHDISSFTGLIVDAKKVYVTDATSLLWAFDNDTGVVAWRQSQLEARVITGPVKMGKYLVVGDKKGYLHWVSKEDGHFVARVKVNHSGILATPVVENNILYALTKDGHLAAYSLGL